MFNMRKSFVVLSMLFAFSFLGAIIHGKMPGGEPYAAWEDGSQDFFVMFNSNIDNLMEILGEDPNNPQADTCIDESHFTLTSKHIPEDAIIEKAYLVWMGAVDPSKLNDPTDNAVTFKFVQSANSSVALTEQISVGEPGEGNLLSDPNSFEFESIRFTDDVVQGCSPTSTGNNVKDQELGYFTYRKDITEFFDKIYTLNKEVKAEEEDVDLESSIYYGTYSFRDLECTQHDNYRCITTMVSAWAVFFIYRSQGISAKKIYFYDGLSFVQGNTSTAEVGGFELPKNPVVRLTTMVAEGDPGLYEPFLPPEGIFLKGEGATSKFRLWNACNPIVGNYVEVFNSISSLVHWDPAITDNITCVSYEDDWMNYGVEVDTFLLDSEKNINLQEHLKKGNTSMEIELSVNQDAILTNFMVISVDNKGSNFDIPPEASDPDKSKLNFPYDREKHFCGCPTVDDGKVADYWCLDSGSNHREFYYFVKVQNWGDEDTGEVRVWDELDPMLNYIPGTTEYATEYDPATDTYVDWTAINDKAGGAFPLAGDGVTVSTKMSNCNQSSWACKDTVLIRYKVKPKPETQKNHVFVNIANIKDKNDDTAYRTNRSYPLKLAPAQCVRDTECPTPTPLMCGGIRREEPDCGPDQPCPDGLVCDQSGKCVDDPAVTCFNSTAEYKEGKNAPLEIIIPKDNNGLHLTVGQFTLQVNNCEEDRFFNFDALTLNVNTNNDSKFSFKELELFHDVNGNGILDDGDRLLATAEMDGRSAKFFLLNNKKFPGKNLNYFIIRTKVDYNSEEVLRNTKFNFLIESTAAVEVTDQGTTMVNGGKIDFAEFTLEPTGDYFVVTRGLNDPPVPGYKEINTNIPILQVKTKAISKVNELTRMTVRTSPGAFVKFGEPNGIRSLSLLIDTNGDGIGNTKIAEITSFDTITSSIVFENFTQKLTYAPGEIKHFVIYAKFNMKDVPEGERPMAAKIEIPVGGIRLSDTSPTIVELPLRSKEFVYECAPGDPDCAVTEPSKKGCDCGLVSVQGDEISKFLALLAAMALIMLLGRNFAFYRSKEK